MVAGELGRGFITGGTWCLDRNRTIDQWPREDSVAFARTIDERGGGSACNLAIDMRRLDPGMPVATIGLVGDDAAGQRLIAQADEAGLNRDQLRVRAGASTHVVDAFISQASGLRTHVTEAGVSALLTPGDFDFRRTSGRFFHLGLPGIHAGMDRRWQDEPNGWVAVLKSARREGLQTNLELCTLQPQTLRDLVLPCLPYLDLLVVNDTEIGALAEVETVRDHVTDVDATTRAMHVIAARGAMHTVVVHFPGGALALPRGAEVVFVPSALVPPDMIVGPNGAGDAFAAGFLYGVHEGWDLPESVWLGHAAAACSLRTAGTTDGVEGWRECLALAERWARRAV